MRETRMTAGKMSFNRPKTLLSAVTEKGSGSKAQTSYDPLRKVWGQITVFPARLAPVASARCYFEGCPRFRPMP